MQCANHHSSHGKNAPTAEIALIQGTGFAGRVLVMSHNKLSQTATNNDAAVNAWLIVRRGFDQKTLAPTQIETIKVMSSTLMSLP